MWIVWVLLSALLLSLYDICRKHSVRENAVLPTLVLANLSGMVAFLALYAATGRLGLLGALDIRQWLLVLAKSALVATSWTCVYYALRSLPISIVAPIRASAPLWTFFGAFLLFHERPSLPQGIGMLFIFLGYYVFSVAGRAEGISFLRSRGVPYVGFSTLLGAASGLYDKFLLQTCGIPREPMQLWFSIDLVVLLALAATVQRLLGYGRERFVWRWSIPLVGFLLIAADWFYFLALSKPGASVATISLMRRTSVVITFLLGARFFHETNLKAKAVALAAILAGIVLLALA